MIIAFVVGLALFICIVEIVKQLNERKSEIKRLEKEVYNPVFGEIPYSNGPDSYAYLSRCNKITEEVSKRIAWETFRKKDIEDEIGDTIKINECWHYTGKIIFYYARKSDIERQVIEKIIRKVK